MSTGVLISAGAITAHVAGGLTTESVTGAGVRAGVPTLSVNARLLTTLSITSAAGVLICTGLTCADFRAGLAGLAGVGYNPTTSQWGSPYEVPAATKTHIEIKFIVMVHFVFSLQLKIVAPVPVLCTTLLRS
ncbi:MAG: hypothetical protein ACJ8DI_24150 [Ktedonobacteraceae bacterium]